MENANINAAGPNGNVKVNVQTFAAKYKSKKEIYGFLAGPCNAYLAGYENVSIYYLRDLLIGKKKRKCILTITNLSVDIKADKVKHLFVPFYEGLNIDTFIEKALQYPGLKAYIPNGPDADRISRQWLINVIHTVAGDDFADWVHRTVDERNAKVENKNKLTLEMDPEIAEAFYASKQVSSKYHSFSLARTLTFDILVLTMQLLLLAQNGTGVQLLKVGSKRRKTKDEKEALEEE